MGEQIRRLKQQWQPADEDGFYIQRVVLETHNHECVECQTTGLLELDHDPPYEQTRHTITTELEPRCAPCHRARHRREALVSQACQ